MPSARRQKRASHKKRKAFAPFIGIIAFIFLLAVFLVVLFINTKFWNGSRKVAVVEAREDGSVAVEILDPAAGEKITLFITGETEVESARGFGTFRLKNIWKLGVQEGDPGDILTKTLVKNFSFPVHLWRSADGETNIPFGDRIMMFFFERGLPESKKTEIDLAKSQFLIRQKLSDGDLGYKVPSDLSPRISIYFVFEGENDESFKIYVKDLTGSYGTAERVGKLLEVMGGKVVSIEKRTANNSDCFVEGSIKELNKTIGSILSCQVGDSAGTMGISVSIGSAFAERY